MKTKMTFVMSILSILISIGSIAVTYQTMKNLEEITCLRSGYATCSEMKEHSK